MANLVTQNVLEGLIYRNPAAGATQIVEEALILGGQNAYATNLSMAVLYDPTPPVPAVASQIINELLKIGQGNLYATQNINESLIERIGSLYATQNIMEVLIDFDELSPDVPLYIPMSNYIFPTLSGLTWSVIKRPLFSTTITPHVSGREVRVSNYAYPLWEWELTYEFLRAGVEQELQTLMGFFLARSGSFDSFLYKDANENNIYTGVSLGSGDNVQTKWTLMKTYSGFSEPCGYVDPASIQIYFNTGGGPVAQTTGWTFVSPNQIVFATPPAAGTAITADYTWYYRVRFGDDSQDYDNFMFDLWTLKKLTLHSVKP